MNTTCPFCDSTDVEKIEVTDSYPVPFCGETEIQHATFRCNSCEEAGDFDNSLDRSLTKAIDRANIVSAPRLLDDLSRIGITMTYMEKALRLPFRTTARWKRGKISHSSLALLRLIRFAPALLEVADDNYSDQAQNRYHVTQPWYFIVNNTTNPSAFMSVNNGVIDIKFQGQMTTTPQKTISTGNIFPKWVESRC